MSHKALGLGKGEWGEVSGGLMPEISTCLTGGVLLWNGLINCVQGNMTTWVGNYLRRQKWGVWTLSFSLPLWIGTTRGFVTDEIWIGREYFLPPSPIVDFSFLIRHTNTPVPSRQGNCFADCDSRVTWWQQSNFHMNNYPAVRVGSSFISIWRTRRIVLTKAASGAIVFRALGTGRGLTGLVHFSSILLPWPKYASTLKVGPWAKTFFLLSKQAVRGFIHLYFYKFVDMFCCFCVCVCFDVTTFISGTRLSLIRSLGCSLVCLLICHHSNTPVISLLPAGLLSRKIRDYRRDTCTQHIWMFQCADTLFYQTVSATDHGVSFNRPISVS